MVVWLVERVQLHASYFLGSPLVVSSNNREKKMVADDVLSKNVEKFNHPL